MTVTLADVRPGISPVTAEQLRLLPGIAAADELVAVGLAVHHFTNLVADLVPIVELHRATTVLTKQLVASRITGAPLTGVRLLAADPNRVALPTGRTAAELCGDAWAEVSELAERRAVATIDGAAQFGESAILHLAAARAAGPSCPWWGTPGWSYRVAAWLGDGDANLLRSALLRTPEYVGDEVLAAILG